MSHLHSLRSRTTTKLLQLLASKRAKAKYFFLCFKKMAGFSDHWTFAFGVLGKYLLFKSDIQKISLAIFISYSLKPIYVIHEYQIGEIIIYYQ